MLTTTDTALTDAVRSFHLEDRPRSTEGVGISSYLRWCTTPGVSIAVIDGSELATTWCGGVRDANTRHPVDPKTRFQAGSVSKPVAAACALRLVAEGGLDLDDDVNDGLRPWQDPNEDSRRRNRPLGPRLSH